MATGTSDASVCVFDEGASGGGVCGCVVSDVLSVALDVWSSGVEDVDSSPSYKYKH